LIEALRYVSSTRIWAQSHFTWL